MFMCPSVIFPPPSTRTLIQPDISPWNQSYEVYKTPNRPDTSPHSPEIWTHRPENYQSLDQPIHAWSSNSECEAWNQTSFAWNQPPKIWNPPSLAFMHPFSVCHYFGHFQLFWSFGGPLRVPGGPQRNFFWLLLLISCSTTKYLSNTGSSISTGKKC